MYHHVNSDACSNDLDIFAKHLKYISQNFTSVFPTFDKLPKRPITLIFDDAYFDFYHFIFPLLQKYNLKALLAVPTNYILDDTAFTPQKRLSFKHDEMYENYKFGCFCTFKELQILHQSNLVKICSHSHLHVNLKEPSVDLKSELMHSKNILESKLNTTIDTFVYPFGKYNQNIQKQVSEIYKFSFRIGNAVHKDFNGINGVNYRIKGDGLKSADEIFKPTKILKYRLKAFVKRISGD